MMTTGTSPVESPVVGHNLSGSQSLLPRAQGPWGKGGKYSEPSTQGAWGKGGKYSESYAQILGR